MSKATDMLKEILASTLKELVKDMFTDNDDKVQVEVKEEKEKITSELEILKEKVKNNKIEPATTAILSSTPGRIIRITNEIYYCKSIKTTTFCNEEDFNEEWYPLATNSPYTRVQKGKMKGMRGVSLSVPIDRKRIVYPIVPLTGVSFGYKQVDVGPGYTNDKWFTEGRNPKNETGIDQFGRKSVNAGLDVWPQVLEDLGVATFEEAYERSLSFTFDMMIFNPSSSTIPKATGHDSPTGDKRPWFKDLPFSGSEFFPWKEMLRGWNHQERPSNEQIQNLIKLTTEMLHPIRLALGAIKVSNGLRDQETNKRVGGREGSFHLVGRAADLVPLETDFKTLYGWINANLKTKIRENVFEYPNSSNTHVHLAGPWNPGENQNIRIKV